MFGGKIYEKSIVELIDRNYLIHKAVKAGNENLYKYFLEFKHIFFIYNSHSSELISTKFMKAVDILLR